MQPGVNIDDNLQSQHIQVFVLKILLKILSGAASSQWIMASRACPCNRLVLRLSPKFRFSGQKRL